MSKYLDDCNYAAENLIILIADVVSEYEELKEMGRQALESEGQFHYFFLQRQMHPSANFFYEQFKRYSDKRAKIEHTLEDLKETINTKFDAVNMLCSALLQISKQGLSKAYKNPNSCQNSRMVGDIDLKWAVWSGRNQSQHFEEPKKINAQTIENFEKMKKAFRKEIDAKDGKNHAYDVIIALGWLDYNQFKNDMTKITK